MMLGDAYGQACPQFNKENVFLESSWPQAAEQHPDSARLMPM